MDCFQSFFEGTQNLLSVGRFVRRHRNAVLSYCTWQIWLKVFTIYIIYTSSCARSARFATCARSSLRSPRHHALK